MVFIQSPEENEIFALVLYPSVNIKPFFVAQRLFSRARIPLDTDSFRNIKYHIEVQKLADAVEVVNGTVNIGCLIDKFGQDESFELLG